MKNRIAISGIAGKMGQAISQAAFQRSDTNLSLGLIRPEKMGQSMAQLLNDKQATGALVDTLDGHIDDYDVLIDFSSPVCSVNLAKLCARDHKPIVIGTTGFSQEQSQELEELSKKTKILCSPNMSYGMNLCLHILQKLSANLINQGCDIDIIEAHHKNKKDSPSGSALAMGDAIQQAIESEKKSKSDIDPNCCPPISYHSIRSGNVVGEHTALFSLPGERIELTHKASDRSIFARGAIEAAHWLLKQNQSHGLYSMKEVVLS